MLAARERCWLYAHDLCTYNELSDPQVFTAAMVGRWIGEIGLAYQQLGRLLQAHNHMQEALLYLGFQPLPQTALQRTAAIILGMARSACPRLHNTGGSADPVVAIAAIAAITRTGNEDVADDAGGRNNSTSSDGPGVGSSGGSGMQSSLLLNEVLMALRLYEGIASICLKTGHAREVRYVRRLVKLAARRLPLPSQARNSEASASAAARAQRQRAT